MFVSDQGVVTNKYGSYPDEVFYLFSPNGTSWQITTSGTTGLQTIEEGLTGSPIGIQIVDPIGSNYTASISNAGVLTFTNELNYTIEVSVTPTYTQETP